MKMGVSRAEASTTAAVITGDRVLIQRYESNNNGAYWVPLESTVDELAAFVFSSVTTSAGKVTLVGGTATVAYPEVTTGSVILLTEANATPNAVGYTINAGVGFTITSSSGSDTSSVSYLVLN